MGFFSDMENTWKCIIQEKDLNGEEFIGIIKFLNFVLGLGGET